MTAVLLAAFLLGGGAAAAVVAAQRWGWQRGQSAAALVLAPALVYGALSLAEFAWSWSNGRGGRASLVALAILIGAALVCATPRRSPRRVRGSERLPRRLAPVLVLVGALTLVGVTATASLLARALPIGRYDAHAIWNAHAAFLFRAADGLPQRFQRMERDHPDYPLFLPGAVAGQWALLGEDSPAVPQFTGAVLFLAVAATIGAALAAFDRPLAGCLGTALYLTTPNALHWGFGQCADVPVSYLFAIAAAGCAGMLAGERAAPLPPVLTGFALGLLAWTKNEGTLWAAVLIGITVGHQLDRFLSPDPPESTRQPTAVGLPALTAGAMLPVLALVLFKVFWSPRSEMAMFLDGSMARLADPARWATVAAAFWGELNPVTGWPRWGVLWPLLVVGCVWSAVQARRDPIARVLLLALGGSFALCVLIYVAGPTALDWQLRTSLDRLLLQLVPLALIAALIGMGDPARSAVDAPRRETARRSPNR